MTMKKILMAAVAVSALTAGAANAASITTAKVSGLTVYDATQAAASRSTPYKIANETKFPAAGYDTTSTYADNFVELTTDQGLMPAGTYGLTYTYTGPIGFKNAVAPGDLVTNAAGTCASGTSTIVQSGGQALAKSVTFLVTLPASCTTVAGANVSASTFKLKAPLTVTGSGTVAATAGLTAGGVSIDNGDAVARTLITNAAGFTASVTADTVPTTWALGATGTTAYTTLTANNGIVSDRTLGKYTVAAVTPASGNPIYVTADAVAGKLVTAMNLATTTTVSGDVSVVDVTAGGVALSTLNAAKTTATGAAAIGTDQTITVAVVAAGLTASQSTKSYSVTVTPVTSDTALFTIPSPVTAALQDIGLEGTSLLAPWVAGSEQANFSTSIRLVNTGSTPVSAVTLQLRAPVTLQTPSKILKTTCTSADVGKLSSIAANSELLLSKDDFKTCFGEFKRGDVLIIVQGANTNLSAKMRNVDTTTGTNSEISLGGLKQTGLSY